MNEQIDLKLWNQRIQNENTEDVEFKIAHDRCLSLRSGVRKTKWWNLIKSNSVASASLFVFIFNFFFLFIYLFFSISVFFNAHSQFTGLQGKGEAIYLTPLYHLHLLRRHLNIIRAIAAESSPLHIASSRTRTRNLWFPSASR